MRGLVALLALLPAVAQAARPFVTDDARTVDRGGCQVETFYKSQRADTGSEFWFLPACNPFGIELTAGANRIEENHSLVLQGKTLVRPLETNGAGFAFSVGAFRTRVGGAARTEWSPYVNGIASFSYFDDRVVLHTNAGAIRDRVALKDRATWGVGAEILAVAPRLYAIVETFGQYADKPTLHYGARYWIVPNRVQLDSTLGEHREHPRRRFYTVGLRVLW